MIELNDCFCCLLAYFLPTIVALLQRKKISKIFTINLFFGWTVVGWLIAMYIAVINKQDK